jgi:integrase
MSPLPKGISAGELDRLPASCDRQCARGRRDYAILCLLSPLGLRAGEVAAMVLEDLDWRRGELGIVYDACDRAGIARVGAHRLRHTAASRMQGRTGIATIGLWLGTPVRGQPRSTSTRTSR